MLLNNDTILEIIGNNKRFINPYDEPHGYYIFDHMNCLKKEFDDELISLYYEKLRYAVSHTDNLIKSAFDNRFYDFYGIDRSIIKSPTQMCSELLFDSFVMISENKSICSCLSNSQFMFGHFIEVSWDRNWKIKYAWIN